MIESTDSLTTDDIYVPLYKGVEPILEELEPFPEKSTVVKVQKIAIHYFDKTSETWVNDCFGPESKKNSEINEYPLRKIAEVFIGFFIVTAAFIEVLLLWVLYDPNSGRRVDSFMLDNSYRANEQKKEDNIFFKEAVKQQLLDLSSEIVIKMIHKGWFSSLNAEIFIEATNPNWTDSKFYTRNCKIL